MNKVAVLGEALIDFIADSDGAFRPHLGGSPYNVAIALARQTVDVSYLSTLSEDAFGDLLMESLLVEGVKTPVERRSLWPTSLALVTINQQGQPSYRLYREGIADKDVTALEVIEHTPKDIKVFHTGSLAITPSQLPKIREIFEHMRRHNVRITVDINIRLRASIDAQAYLAGVRSLLPLADIVKASDEDLVALEIDPSLEKTAKIVFEEMGSGLLVLTKGSGGATLIGQQGIIDRPGYSVANMADTVGAGDTFHAAFVSFLCRAGVIGLTPELIDKMLLEQALDYACAAAAINVTRVGCSPPTHSEVIDMMKGTNG